MPGPASFSFDTAEWIMALLGAFAIGLNKGGLTGLGILPVVCFAYALPPRESTGLVLPLLLVGDVCSITAYRKVVVWPVFFRLLPPTIVGVFIGYNLLGRISAADFGPVIGWLVLALIAVQIGRDFVGTRLDRLFHSRVFGLFMGVLTGITTMLANAAGPVANLYFLSIRLPKLNLIGTSAWLFFVTNCVKVPFSAHLGLINAYSLHLGLVLALPVLLGFFLGNRIAALMPEKIFARFLLACTLAGALRLVW